MDFTLKTYKTLIESLVEKNYQFLTVEEYFKLFFSKSPNLSLTIMRHDVDRKPLNALRMAKIEHKLGIKATYFFRTIDKTFKPEIIKEIVELGHEIAYHYECLSETNGDFEKALKDFEKNLARLRELFPVNNIAMHGSPLSKWDSRDLWKKYNYKDYNITSEPYFDIDFDKVLYITDAGRSWENKKINKRDKVTSKFNYHFKHTNDIITALEQNKLSDKIMINIHPEHWSYSEMEWWKIWIIRKIRNFGKRIFLGLRSKV